MPWFLQRKAKPWEMICLLIRTSDSSFISTAFVILKHPQLIWVNFGLMWVLRVPVTDSGGTGLGLPVLFPLCDLRLKHKQFILVNRPGVKMRTSQVQ